MHQSTFLTNDNITLHIQLWQTVSNIGTKSAYLYKFLWLENSNNMIVYKIYPEQSYVYQVVILSPQQHIKILILLHRVGSETVSHCMYTYFVILAKHFFLFFVLCRVSRIKLYVPKHKKLHKHNTNCNIHFKINFNNVLLTTK